MPPASDGISNHNTVRYTRRHHSSSVALPPAVVFNSSGNGPSKTRCQPANLASLVPSSLTSLSITYLTNFKRVLLALDGMVLHSACGPLTTLCLSAYLASFVPAFFLSLTFTYLTQLTRIVVVLVWMLLHGACSSLDTMEFSRFLRDNCCPAFIVSVVPAFFPSLTLTYLTQLKRIVVDLDWMLSHDARLQWCLM